MFRNLFNTLKSACLVSVFIFCVTSAAQGKEDASIYDMAVMNSDEHLLLYFRIKDAFTEEMEKGIESGIPITLTYYIALFQNRVNLTKKKIDSFDFNQTLSYDTLKEQYSVQLDEEGERVVMIKSLEAAKMLMLEVNDLKIFDLENLVSGQKYFVRAKVRLGKKILPLNFHYIIPFRNFWEFNTEWSEIEFVR